MTVESRSRWLMYAFGFLSGAFFGHILADEGWRGALTAAAVVAAIATVIELIPKAIDLALYGRKGKP